MGCLEYEMTLRILARHLPRHGRVLDVQPSFGCARL